MLGTFAITLRELAELALIVATLGACLRESHPLRWVRWMWLSAVLGMLIGGALGASLLDWAEMDLRSTSVVHIAVALGIVFMVSTSLIAESRIALETRARLAGALAHPMAPWLVAGFACFFAGREVFEIVVLVNSVWKPEKAAAQLSGVALGGVVALALALSWKRVGARVEGLALFRLSALVTAVVAVELLLDGVGGYLYAEGTARPGYQWMVDASRALEAGGWVGWVCAALLAAPALQVFRSIWRSTAARAGG